MDDQTKRFYRALEKRVEQNKACDEEKAKICNRYSSLIGKNFKTKSGTRFKVISMVSTTAFGALFVVEYAGGFKFGTMIPTAVEECANQVPLKDMTEEEAREEIRRFYRNWKEDRHLTYSNPRKA